MYDITDWFLNDYPLYGINIGDNIAELKNKLNFDDLTLNGHEHYGYYYMPNGYRFGFCNKIIDEIGIDFDKLLVKVVFRREGGYYVLGGKKIHEILDFLNDNFIGWTAIKSLDTQYLMVKIVSNKIVLIFDVYEGTLSKITKSNMEL